MNCFTVIIQPLRSLLNVEVVKLDIES